MKKRELQSFTPCDSYCICSNPLKLVLQYYIFGKIVNFATLSLEIKNPTILGYICA